MRHAAGGIIGRMTPHDTSSTSAQAVVDFWRDAGPQEEAVDQPVVARIAVEEEERLLGGFRQGHRAS